MLTSLDATLHLPPGATASTPHGKFDLSDPAFGQFALTVNVSSDGKSATLRSRFAMPEGRLAPARYGEFSAYAETVDAAEAKVLEITPARTSRR